ncbi:ATP-binding cassette domain-containing protein [Salinirubellus salinus]|uniref:ATP-binding cassette domain-containing protein n=1 Tax=Salinirubellus salinus TaxID=1364945 RepID=A0A9E7U7A6_9EURY|nr:ATP-binding cassette domain-containing protein [Salinirubellus salinus]UWM53386.1 ATP-binding cassette domain-containing protein [Salinirubellus salinus]
MPGGRLETEGLTKTFGDVVAADDVTVTFEPGECHGIIGPNGSGKTTLFDLVMGFQRPDSGVVRFDGEDITGMRPDQVARRGLVRTFQITAPFERLTVRENLLSVYTGGLGSGLRVPTETHERAAELLDLLDLDRVADHDASDISGGQQKLLELGRATMLEPECVLLDEPTAGVNPAIQDRVLSALREMNDGGTTVVVIEHDMSVVGDIADRITVLDGGRVLTQGAFSTVTSDERVRDAYIGTRTDRATGTDGEMPATETETGTETQTGTGTEVEAGTPTPGVVAESRARRPAPAESDAESRVARALASRADGDEDDERGPVDRLVARNVTAGYGKQVVLDGVSVKSHDGITCVFGPNGSGKSTLLKLLGGVVPVRSGAIEYGGRPLTGLEPHEIVRAGITTVPQDRRTFAGLTVRENLQLGATTVDDEAVVDARIEVVLDLFPALAASLSEPARSLSGGQQVMLGLGWAMMTGADVYLLDEPLSGLAPSAVDDLFDVLRTLVDRGIQIVLVEQHVREAMTVADHVYVLSQGRIQFDGPPEALESEDRLVELYLGLE